MEGDGLRRRLVLSGPASASLTALCMCAADLTLTTWGTFC